jgi:hypothetical protein
MGAGTSDPVELSVFLATPPLAAELLPGGLCAFDDLEYVGQYLAAHHSTGPGGQARVLSLLVPHDSDHAAPALQRLSGPGYTGASLAHASGVTDVVLESGGATPVMVGAQLVRAVGAWYRQSGGVVRAYFLARGRAFDAGLLAGVGLESSADLTAHVRGTVVHLTSAGATVTFRDPQLTGFVFSSEAGTVLAASAGRVEFALNPGTFALDLETGLPPP